MQKDNSSFWTDIKTYEEQLSKSPDSFCFARLSEVYLKVGLVDDALHTARLGVAKHPGYMGGQRTLAMACNAKGLNDECLTALKLLTIAIPEDSEAQKLLGRLMVNAGDYDAARQALHTVLEFYPDDVECRIELESFERIKESVPPTLYEEEEIIEDIEILEELDIFEEDLPDSGMLDEEQSFVPEIPVRGHHDPLSTGTLAELYVKQGFIHKALEIYRAILLDDPGNREVSTRISELEQLDAVAVEPAPVFGDILEYESDDSLAGDSVADISLPGNLSDDLPESNDLFEISGQKKGLLAESSENLSAVLKPQGIADNALSTLEGWLENVRRVKSCR